YTYEVRNRNTWTRSDASFLSKSHVRQWSGNLASPISLFGWALDASDVDIQYEDPFVPRPERKSRIARARLFFQPDPTLRLSASVGREENNFVLEQMQSYDTYGYGLLWRPGPRTTAQFDWERRYFGISPVASFEHRMRLSTFNLSYSKTSSSYQQELFRVPPGSTAQMLDSIFTARIPDPVQRQQAVEQFMRANATPPFLSNSLSFFTDQIFVQERLQGSFTLLGVRNSISFTAFGARSKNVTQAPPALPADVFAVAGTQVNQHGFGANASHRLTSFTSLSASANRTYASSPDSGINSVTDYASLYLSHTVSPKTTTFESLTYTHFDSSNNPATRARSVVVGLFHRF
ncbi:MAG TPA: TIGR03016 family PEP-CTERM system-associated outer membrane protein, partial [Burkholderiales bacterium]|nr:TIGR03016 family PEP-CTERM system-associated outer membrane protein [Burkholderiales bacterium]